MKESKKLKLLSIIIIAVITSVLLSVSITLFVTQKINNTTNINISDFKIEYFDMESEPDVPAMYKQKKGIITCSDTQNIYLLTLESTDKKTAEKSHEFVYVINGQGGFLRYVQTFNDYENRIIGFQVLNK